MVDILKKQGTMVEALSLSRGHGFAKRENQIDAMRRSWEWFERYLRRKEANLACANKKGRVLPPLCSTIQ